MEGVRREYARRPLLVEERDGGRVVTTPEVLAEEDRLVAFAREGRGTRQPLGVPGRPLRRDWLNEGQRQAVRHILSSRDRVILLRGAAGTGKTTLMQEAVEAIGEGGRQVVVLAPSAGASRDVLRGGGFKDADTVAMFLKSEAMQQRAAGQVVWVDEAGPAQQPGHGRFVRHSGAGECTGDPDGRPPPAFQPLARFAAEAAGGGSRRAVGGGDGDHASGRRLQEGGTAAVGGQGRRRIRRAGPAGLGPGGRQTASATCGWPRPTCKPRRKRSRTARPRPPWWCRRRTRKGSASPRSSAASWRRKASSARSGSSRPGGRCT